MDARIANGLEGFSLIETVVAIALLAVAVLSLVQLTWLATAANAEARRGSMSALLAADKLEELKMAASYPAAPIDALQQNASGFCDFLDAAGRPIGPSGATTMPIGAAFLRRWSIRLAGPGMSDSITLEVVAVPDPATRAAGSGPRRHRGEARVSAIVTRRP